MAIYGVIVRRETTESAWVEVEAGSIGEAEALALSRANDDEYSYSWNISDEELSAEVDG